MSAFEMITPRLRLRSWDRDDCAAFAALNADPEVMADLGGPLDRTASDKKLNRYRQAYLDRGYGRWVIENRQGAFLGYAGIMHVAGDHPLGPHNEIGWRLCRAAWGYGYASEAARAALQDGFDRVGLQRVISYTASDNRRSQAVMERLGLRRDPSLDFTAEYDVGSPWSGLVWVTP
ncbi:MAG: GNAT family N-acetyltransferase [Pseudomonadota bacterium]